jgi:uncharacterized membrane protein HdeD (DUF308 family)
MEKTKSRVGVISLLVGVAVFVFFKPSGPNSFSGAGIAIAYMIYSRIVAVLMILAGIIAYTTRRSNSKFSAVVAGLIHIIATFITFNEFSPSTYTPFLLLKGCNAIMAILLLFSKPEE